MDIYYERNNVILSNVSDFNLIHTFECGQCFRWNRQDDGSYFGIAKGKALKIAQRERDIILYNTSREDFESTWYDYFDLATDYSHIKAVLSNDEILKAAIPFGNGIRILKQDLWETVVSFIISASNNIPRIKKIIELLCSSFGEEIYFGESLCYSFPDYKKLSKVSKEDLSVIRAGFRDKYILDAAEKFSRGLISEDTLKNLDTENAKKLLLTVSGIGNKVADCILLFGLSRFDVFPIDVWIKRIMETLYLDGEASNAEIQAFADKKFGSLKGVAQQYLFFYARENLKEL